MSVEGPPRIGEHLLERALGRGTDRAEAILGDLFEEYTRRARHTSALRASAWYAAQVVRLSARFAATRSAARRRPRRQPVQCEVNPRGDRLMRTLGLELRYAARALLQRPALALVVVITLALGLGANAAILAMVDALVLRPFTFEDLDRIAFVTEPIKGQDLDTRETTAPANFLDWKAQADVFERLAAVDWWDANLSGRDEPEALHGFFVSADFFPALGIQPAIGRVFRQDEERVGEHRRVMLSYGLWQRRFGGDRGIVGQPVTLDGQPYEVVGVTPPNFDFPLGAELWAPLAFDAETAARRTSHDLTVIGRLAPGRSLEDAQAAMTVIGDRLRTQYPEENRNRDVRVMTLSRGMMDQGLGPILSLWQASALFVLLIACTNIAGLLLARGAERQRDIAVRLAMGAPRSRIVRELLFESVLLALIAVPASCGLAWIALAALRSGMPAKIARFLPGWSGLDVDGRLVLATTLLALGTAIVFGLVPAIQALRPGLLDTLRDGGRGATAGHARQRLRRALVVAEITLALPLLVAASMAINGINTFLNGPQGYTPDGVLSMLLSLPDPKYTTPDARRQFTSDVLEQLRAVPGVEEAAGVNIRPALGSNSGRRIEIDGRPNADPANPPEVDYRTASPDYFTVLRIPLLSGRGFTVSDREGARPVAIVSASMAKRFWPDVDPLGRRLRIDTGPWLTIIGVSGDVIHDWFARRNAPTLYLPYAQAPSGSLSLLVRTSGSPDAIADAVRRAVHRVDSAQPIIEMMTMRDSLRERTLGLQYIAGVMTVFGGLALLLAVIGVYGVIAYFVTQRRHEIGVRMALGATRRDVVRLAVGQTGRLTVLGALLGAGLSLALGRLIEAGLFGSVAIDLRVVGGLAGVLALAAVAAGYVPARRAAAVDPNVALRSE